MEVVTDGVSDSASKADIVREGGATEVQVAVASSEFRGDAIGMEGV